MVANGGRTTSATSDFHAVGLRVQIDVVGGERDVQDRLARGGADPEGADIAVLPLPVLVASYEKLRALEPQVVYVVGWSSGREVLFGNRDGLLAKPTPGTAPVTVAFSDDSSAALALFALDATGTSAGRIHLVDDPKGAAFFARVRPLALETPAEVASKLLLGTADASRFVPIVAIAARGFIGAHLDVSAAVDRAWMAGTASMQDDVPAAARRIAGEVGAPEPSLLLERLAWMTPATGNDGARALGVVGHDAVTVTSLFAQEWRLLREIGALTSPAPDRSPVAPGPLAAALAGMPERPPVVVDTVAPAPSAHVLLVHRMDKAAVDAVAADVAWLSGIFDRSTVRVSCRPASLAKEAVAAAHDQLGVPQERAVASTSPPADAASAVIEVLAVP